MSDSRFRPTVTVACPHDFETAISRAWDAIARLELSVFTTFDHGRAAIVAGTEVEPSQVIAFGDASRLGDVLAESPSAGLEFPLRLLIHRNPEGSTFLTYYEPGALVQELRLDERVAPTFNVIQEVVDLICTEEIVIVDDYRKRPSISSTPNPRVPRTESSGQ